jgi:hypothetical protein
MTQAFFDTLSEGWRKQRSNSQMTLGQLIEQLRSLPKDSLIQNLCRTHSYRGYYSDLALEDGGGSRTVEGLLEDLEESLNEVFQGYKGGDFHMGSDTPLWIAEYGRTGVKIMSLEYGDVITFNTEEDN